MIKTIFLAILVSFVFSRSYAQDQPGQSESHSVIKFTESTFDFGDMPLDANVSHKFEFKNISKDRIAIKDVKTSCGCTTPQYSTDPVKPGRKGNVVALYDSKRKGPFVKTLTVLVSDGEEVVLTIKGNIKVPDVGAALPTKE